jgi:hypothetical protein
MCQIKRYEGMSNKQDEEAMIYQIRIEGQLGEQWTDWFEGLTITQEAGGTTVLTGPVLDQSALHGLLKKVRDLGAPLVSVNRMETDGSSNPNEITKGEI